MHGFWQTVHGRSMRPTLADGDEVLLEHLSSPPAPGDVVVARRSRGGLVLHRVVASGRAGIETQGDACAEADPIFPPRAVLFRATLRRRGGRVTPIPPRPAALRIRWRLRRRLAPLTAALGRWWRARRSCSTSTRGACSG